MLLENMKQGTGDGKMNPGGVPARTVCDLMGITVFPDFSGLHEPLGGMFFIPSITHQNPLGFQPL